MTRTVFVITEQAPPLASIIALLTVGLAAGCLLLVLKRLHNKFMRRAATAVLLVICLTTLFIGMKRTVDNLSTVFHLADLQFAIRQYQHGDYVTFEGVVSDCRVNGRGDVSIGEICFCVAANPVCINLSRGGIGYHLNGAYYPIEDGMRVKIFYHDPVILRVDVFDSPRQ